MRPFVSKYENLKVRPPNRIPDSHLQSPVRNDIRQQFCYPGRKTKQVKSLIEICPVSLRNVMCCSEKTYGVIFSALNTSSIILDSVRKHFPENYHLGKEKVDDVLKTIGVEVGEGDWCPDTPTLRKYSYKQCWENIRKRMQYLVEKKIWEKIRHPITPGAQAQLCSDLLILDIEGTLYAYDYQQVMMIADTVASRTYCYLLSSCMPPSCPGHLPEQIISSVYHIFDGGFRDKGNGLYNEIKCVESLVHGVAIEKHDPYPGRSAFINTIVADLKKDNLSHAIELWEYLKTTELTIEQYAELHGLFRHWGHPTVDESLGCEKVKKIGHETKIFHDKTITQINGALRRQFCAAFIMKHGRWPRVYFLDGFGDVPLTDAITSHNVTLNLQSPHFPLEHWAKMHFIPEFEFDYYVDYSELLEDKSISPEKNEIPAVFDPELLDYKAPKLTTSRRVLIEAIKRPSISIEDICKKIQLRQVPDRWKVVLVHAKERELKIAPRLFAMMVLEMRLYFCATEANIAEHIFPYFPQQSMTMDESELTKRILSLCKEQEHEGAVMLSNLIGVDFSSWNLHQRHYPLSGTFEMIDELHGTPNLFNYTHHFFEESMIVLGSFLNPPESLKHTATEAPKECDTLWYNHKGGFEGLRQKLWTLFTIGLLLLTEFETGIKCIIIGQGDNQVCKVYHFISGASETTAENYRTNHPQDIIDRNEKFMTTLARLSEEVGLKVKPEESWITESFFIYGKDMVFKGAYLPQANKRFSRLLPEVNEVYPTIASKISSLQTAALSAVQKGHSIVTPFILGITECLMTLVNDLKFSLILGESFPAPLARWASSFKGKSFLMRVPTDIGGYPFQPFLSYLYRGHPDSLTATLSELYTDSSNEGQMIYRWLEDNEYNIGHGSSELLVTNPCSINIETPPTVNTLYKSAVEDLLCKVTVNRDFVPLFSLGRQRDDQQFFETLTAIKPVFPRFLHEVSRQTPVAAAQAYISKFGNSRTLVKLQRGGQYEELKVSVLLARHEVIQLEFLEHMYQEMIEHVTLFGPKPIRLCPSQLAQLLRDRTWGHLLDQGEKIEGVTIPHPYHQFVITFPKSVPGHRGCSGSPEYILNNSFTTDKSKLLRERGPYPPYLGSKTVEKIKGRILMVPTASRPFRAAERICQLLSWCAIVASTLEQFLVHLMSLRTDIPREVVQLSSGFIQGGSMVHRLNDHATRRGTQINFRPNSSSHIYLSTDTMGKFSRGADNYNIHFQGAIHLGNAWYQLQALSPGDIVPLMHIHISCDHCVQEVPETILTLTKPWSPMTVHHTPLLFFSHSVLSNMKDLDATGAFDPGNATPAAAIAHIIFERFLVESDSNIWGIHSGDTNPAPRVGIQEILKVGIKPVMHELSLYLLLQAQLSAGLADLLTALTSPRVWLDIAQFCLLPEILAQLTRLVKREGPAQSYARIGSVCQMLSDYLLICLEHHIRSLPTSPPVFFLTRMCGFYRVTHMWISYLSRKHKRPLYLLAAGLFSRGPASLNLPSREDIQTFMSRIRLQYGSELVHQIHQHHGLTISPVPPEGVMLQARKLSYPMSLPRRLVVPNMAKLTKCMESGMVIDQEIPLLSGIPVLTPTTVMRERQIVEPKTRQDQAFRPLGELSTAFLKYIEVIASLKLNLANCQALCLAEGEGSAARTIYHLTKVGPIIVTLVDRKCLVSHRSVHYTPGCFADLPGVVKGMEISTLLGGDITDSKVQEALYEFVESNGLSCKIMTCDAETGGAFSPRSTLDIVCSAVAIGYRLHIPVLIVKIFGNHTQLLSKIVGRFALFYRQVKIVCPCYSSNENSELFIVAQGLQEISPPADPPGFEQIYVDQSSSSLMTQLHEIRKMKISPKPYQWDHIPKCREMLRFGRSMGFYLNLNHALVKLIIHTRSCDIKPIKTEIGKWVNDSIIFLHASIKKELRAAYKVSIGAELTKAETILLRTTQVVSHTLERFSIAYLNMHIVKESLSYTKPEFVVKLIRLYKDKTHRIGSHIGKMYDQALPSWWDQMYLSAIWRVWGHYHLGDELGTLDLI